MMAAVAPKVWALFPHIIALVNVSGTTTYAKANAFIVPLGASDAALLFPVMLGEAPTGTVELNLTAIDRAWAGKSTHPLVRKRAAAAASESAGAGAGAPAAAASFIFEAIWPGQGNICEHAPCASTRARPPARAHTRAHARTLTTALLRREANRDLRGAVACSLRSTAGGLRARARAAHRFRRLRGGLCARALTAHRLDATVCTAASFSTPYSLPLKQAPRPAGARAPGARAARRARARAARRAR